MEQYSRRFIEELAKHINPAILEFYNKKRNLMNFPADNVAELIDETLMEYLEGKTSREDLMPIINKIKKLALDMEDVFMVDRKSTRLNSSHSGQSRMPSSA